MRSSKKFTKTYLSKLPISFIILILLFAGAVYLFASIVDEVIWEKEDELDHSIFQFLATYIRSDRLTNVMEGVSFFASATFLQISYTLLAVYYLIFKDYKRTIEIAFIGTGGFLINYLMKNFFQRPRPLDPLTEPLHNFSFPSGHATSAFIFYGLLVYLLWKSKVNNRLKYISSFILISFALLIGFSRIYLRLHYPSDVIAGFCAGFSWLCFSVWLFVFLKKRSDKESHSQENTAHSNKPITNTNHRNDPAS